MWRRAALITLALIILGLTDSSKASVASADHEFPGCDWGEECIVLGTMFGGWMDFFFRFEDRDGNQWTQGESLECQVVFCIYTVGMRGVPSNWRITSIKLETWVEHTGSRFCEDIDPDAPGAIGPELVTGSKLQTEIAVVPVK